jgi:hypothetical protein
MRLGFLSPFSVFPIGLSFRRGLLPVAAHHLPGGVPLGFGKSAAGTPGPWEGSGVKVGV